MKQTKVGIRYAKALFDLTLERNAVEQGLQDMLLILEVYEENRDLRLFLDSPIINPEKKVAVLLEIFGKKVSETVIAFITILARKRRETALDDIAREYIHLYKEHQSKNGCHYPEKDRLFC
jgi:F-type H+-transporting ATPase subunit delta